MLDTIAEGHGLRWGSNCEELSMNILTAGTADADPIGAAALLQHADPHEHERFVALENAIWDETTLPSGVIEAVRLHGARLRNCEFCAAVRITADGEHGLSETQIAHLGAPQHRDAFNPEQSAALTLVDHFLSDPRRPDEGRSAEIATVLGTAGVMEVLIACCAFASADLRIALGENREPTGGRLIKRVRANRVERSTSTKWPALDGAVLDPATDLPAVASGLANPLRARVRLLWSGADLPPELVAACIVRSTQVLGVAPGDPVMRFLVPPMAAARSDADDVRGWPRWSVDRDRHTLALAEQVWMDPAGVTAGITDPLMAHLGGDGVIRVAWNLILIGQLHRLALVLHGDRC